jgi:hypothetical protein
MSICITTAFKNIGRGDWADFKRSSDTYFQGFLNLVDRCPFPMFVYLEKDGRKKLAELRPQGLRKGVTVLPMEAVTYAPIYTHEKRDWEIMQSAKFNEVIKDLKKAMPERSKRMYNMITSSKAAFVRFTKEISPNYDYYVWQDFGTVNLEENGIGIPRNVDERNLGDKIMLQAFPGINLRHRFSPMDMAQIRGTFIAGGTISIPSRLVYWFDQQVRETIDLYHKDGVTNDDQAIFLSTAYRNLDLFDFSLRSNKWCRFWELLSAMTVDKVAHTEGIYGLSMLG